MRTALLIALVAVVSIGSPLAAASATPAPGDPGSLMAVSKAQARRDAQAKKDAANAEKEEHKLIGEFRKCAARDHCQLTFEIRYAPPLCAHEFHVRVPANGIVRVELHRNGNVISRATGRHTAGQYAGILGSSMPQDGPNLYQGQVYVGTTLVLETDVQACDP